MFHKVNFEIRKAFIIVYEMSCTSKSISASYMAKKVGDSSSSAWIFMQKVSIDLKSRELNYYQLLADIFNYA